MSEENENKVQIGNFFVERIGERFLICFLNDIGNIEKKKLVSQDDFFKICDLADTESESPQPARSEIAEKLQVELNEKTEEVIHYIKKNKELEDKIKIFNEKNQKFIEECSSQNVEIKRLNEEVDKYKRAMEKFVDQPKEEESIKEKMKDEHVSKMVEKANDKIEENDRQEEEGEKPYKINDRRKLSPEDDNEDPMEYAWSDFNYIVQKLRKDCNKYNWQSNPALKTALIPKSNETNLEKYYKSIINICEEFLTNNDALDTEDVMDEDEKNIVPDSFDWKAFNREYQKYFQECKIFLSSEKLTEEKQKNEIKSDFINMVDTSIDAYLGENHALEIIDFG